MFFRSRLEDCLDELREDRVQSAQVGTDDQHEEEDDPRELSELPAVRPLDALQLRPHRHEERDKPTALVLLSPLSPAADAARARRGGGAVAVAQRLVVGLEARGRRLLAQRAVAEADVLRRRADLEVSQLDRLLLGAGLTVLDDRVLGMPAQRGRLAALREALLAPLLLASLRALSVASHRLPAGGQRVSL